MADRRVRCALRHLRRRPHRHSLRGRAIRPHRAHAHGERSRWGAAGVVHLHQLRCGAQSHPGRHPRRAHGHRARPRRIRRRCQCAPFPAHLLLRHRLAARPTVRSNPALLRPYQCVDDAGNGAEDRANGPTPRPRLSDHGRVRLRNQCRQSLRDRRAIPRAFHPCCRRVLRLLRRLVWPFAERIRAGAGDGVPLDDPSHLDGGRRGSGGHWRRQSCPGHHLCAYRSRHPGCY